MRRRFSFALLLIAFGIGATDVVAAPADITQLAQAQPAQAQPAPAQPAPPAAPAPAAPSTAAPAADAQPAVEEPIGNVATLVGTASVTRSNETTPLKPKDDIYLNDVVQTAASSALGITFNDATTLISGPTRRSRSTTTSTRTAARTIRRFSTSARAPWPLWRRQWQRPAT
jgi:hypothetical protein